MVIGISIVVGTLVILYLVFQKMQVMVLQKMEELNQKISKDFENASNKSFKESVGFVQDSSIKEVSKALEPIKEQLRNYEVKMNQMIKDEAIERTKMNAVISSVTEMNKGFAEEAKVFAKAMRGDIRALGKFGEDKVELALEASGFNIGVNYLKQEPLSTVEGDIKPDFTIKLPFGRAVFIDSKLPLDLFMKHMEADTEEQKEVFAKEFAKRVWAHVIDLSKKKYHQCTKFQSMDFVLMFVGSDRAISLAVDIDPDLQRKAIEKGILIVGPTTLMASLKSIEFLYREDRQMENLQEIAEVGGHLYQKIDFFVQKLQESQKALDKSQDCLKTAMNHLNRGDKSIMSDAKKLNDLGKFSSKSLPKLED